MFPIELKIVVLSKRSSSDLNRADPKSLSDRGSGFRGSRFRVAAGALEGTLRRLHFVGYTSSLSAWTSRRSGSTKCKRRRVATKSATTCVPRQRISSPRFNLDPLRPAIYHATRDDWHRHTHVPLLRTRLKPHPDTQERYFRTSPKEKET